MPEEVKQNTDAKEGDGDTPKGAGSLMKKIEKLSNPEGLLMILLGMGFDIAGDLTGDEIIPGWFISAGIDLIAVFFFTAWMLFTGRKGWWWKVAIAFILQLIPYLNNATFALGIITMLMGISFPENWETFVYSVL